MYIVIPLVFIGDEESGSKFASKNFVIYIGIKIGDFCALGITFV